MVTNGSRDGQADSKVSGRESAWGRKYRRSRGCSALVLSLQRSPSRTPTRRRRRRRRTGRSLARLARSGIRGKSGCAMSIGPASVVLSSPAESRSPCLSAGQRPVHFPPPVGRTLAARLMTAAPAEGWSTALAPKRIGCDREIPWKDLLQGREPACGRPRRLPIAVVAQQSRLAHPRPQGRSLPEVPSCHNGIFNDM